MKKCAKCNTENTDQAKFCSECGAPLEQAQEIDEQETTVLARPDHQGWDEEEEESTTILSPASSYEEEDEAEEATTLLSSRTGAQQEEQDWYYVESGKSQGPFRRSVFEKMIRDGQLGAQTYIWTKGMSEWTHLDQTEMKAMLPAPVQEDKPEEQPAAKVQVSLDKEPVRAAAPESNPQQEEAHEQPAGEEWYYIRKGQTFGPCTKEEIISYIHNGALNGSSYVWKDGMADWVYLRDSEFASELGRGNGASHNTYRTAESAASGSYTGPETDGNPNNNPNINININTGNTGYASGQSSYLQTRSVIGWIVLSIVTCGIGQYIWAYNLAKDLNVLAADRGRPAGCDPVVSVILMLLSCNIYSIYFFWKEGTLAAQLSRKGYVSNNAGVLAILALFLPLASCAILQDELNTLITSD